MQEDASGETKGGMHTSSCPRWFLLLHASTQEVLGPAPRAPDSAQARLAVVAHTQGVLAVARDLEMHEERVSDRNILKCTGKYSSRCS